MERTTGTTFTLSFRQSVATSSLSSAYYYWLLLYIRDRPINSDHILNPMSGMNRIYFSITHCFTCSLKGILFYVVRHSIKNVCRRHSKSIKPLILKLIFPRKSEDHLCVPLYAEAFLYIKILLKFILVQVALCVTSFGVLFDEREKVLITTPVF